MAQTSLRLLIAAYASGDVTADERRRAEEVLRRSAGARQLLQQLQADARALRQLPRVPAPTTLTDAIMSRLPDAVVAPAPVRSRRWHEAASLATVAGVLIAVCLGTWWAVQISNGPEPVERLAATSPAIDSPRIDEQPDTDPANRPAPGTIARPESGFGSRSSPVPPSDATSEAAGAPTAQPRTELAAPPRSNVEVARVTPPRMPNAFPIRALDQGDVQPRFLSELKSGDSHRIDVFNRDAARAADRVQSVLRQRGVRLIVDAAAADMIKRRQRGAFAIYSGDLSARDWANHFRLLAAIDRQLEDKKPGEGVFDQLVVMPFSAGDQRDLNQSLGFDPATLPRPESDSPETEAKIAVLVPFGQGRSATMPATAKEWRAALERRAGRHSGAIDVLLIFRVPS